MIVSMESSDSRSSSSTVHDLYSLLMNTIPDAPTDVDFKELNYVIYARKSTTGDERQERSIPDQIKDCIERVVKPEGLRIVGEPVEEKQSAKDPGIRPKFSKLLDDIRYGEVDGIIAWHPDRLARNMKEAGEIIDLLDKGILKDIRFATSAFENSPTGKMLLGISFVLSKQYSEHLSESVTRGNRRKTEDGFFFDEQKHGYFIKDGRLYPDGRNFTLLQQAFHKRIEGNATLQEIADWLTSEGYELRRKGKETVKFVWNVNKISNVFHDPIYAGVLKYGKSLAKLQEYYDFHPMISVDDFLRLNKIKSLDSTKIVSSMMINKGRNTKADLLRGVVFCGFCNKSFSSGLTSKQRKDGRIYYYNYKCETDGCEFRGKSVRANKVLNHAYSFLDKHVFDAASNYKRFVEDSRVYTAQYSKDLTSRIMSFSNAIGSKKREYDSVKKLIVTNPDLKGHYNLDEISDELDSLQKDLRKLRHQKDSLKESILTYDEYLELFGSISDRLRKVTDMTLIDGVLRIFFSNFTVKQYGRGKEQRCEITHKLKEPWEGFLKNDDFSCGRGERTRTFDLTVPNRAR